MPELPEVECLTRAVRRVLKGGRLVEASFFRKDLRDPIPIDVFNELLVGQRIDDVFRRSKYMLFRTEKGYAIFHLGMTGNMLLSESAEPKIAHTHAVFRIEKKGGREGFLHFVDPRRFGRIACIEGATFAEHAFFADLGPEPLETKQLGAHLYAASRGKKQPIKPFLMDAHTVVGVGNIYASEALFRAGISPKRSAKSVTLARYERLAAAVKDTLKASIAAGGTTFRDFKNAGGDPGYYKVKLAVYDRAGEPCTSCGNKVRQIRQAGRSTFFCPVCQT
jgi:formamidopyrimidine-DNA glycosylase